MIEIMVVLSFAMVVNMRLFHGSAQYDSIMASGLNPDSEVETDFSDDFRLVSCGGVYLTNELGVAATYAEMASHSEHSLGMDPCVFEVVMPVTSLIADEDKVWSAMCQPVLKHFGGQLDEGMDDAAVEALLEDHSFDAVVKVAGSQLQLDCENPQVFRHIRDAIRAFLIRDFSWQWNPYETHEEELKAINALCALSVCTLTDDWCRGHFEGMRYSVTGRTLEAIGPMTNNDGPRIVGAMKLVLDDNGLTISNVEYLGTFSLDDALQMQMDYIENARHRGVTVQPFEVSGISNTFP